MNLLRRFSFPAILLVLLAGCAAPVQYEYNTAPYGQWHSFAWQAPQAAPVRNPVVDSGILTTRVKQAVAATLTAQGYHQVQDPAQADFLVTYHTAVQRHQEAGVPSVGFAYGGWWNAPFSTVIVNQPAREVRESDLIVDVIEAKTNTLVWRGWLASSLSQGNYSQQAVNEAVKRIFSKFPPLPKS
ncbi:MAG: DUF4136 domain-containing protein [Gammaproteobacteria bacterium]